MQQRERPKDSKKRNNFKIQKNLQGGKHNFYHFCRFFHSFVKGCLMIEQWTIVSV